MPVVELRKLPRRTRWEGCHRVHRAQVTESSWGTADTAFTDTLLGWRKIHRWYIFADLYTFINAFHSHVHKQWVYSIRLRSSIFNSRYHVFRQWPKISEIKGFKIIICLHLYNATYRVWYIRSFVLRLCSILTKFWQYSRKAWSFPSIYKKNRLNRKKVSEKCVLVLCTF